MIKSRLNLEVKINWFTATLNSMKVAEVIEMLNIDKDLFRKVPKTIQHKTYTCAYECGSIIIIFGDSQKTDENPRGLGSYLVLSGKGCSQLSFHLERQKCTIIEFIQSLFLNEPKLSINRLDIAIDDTNPIPYFTIEQIHQKSKRKEYRSKSRTFDYQESDNGVPDTAKTVYIGSRKSTIFYRFYDKDKEMSRKQHIPLAQIGSRKRTEIELKDYKATLFAYELAKGQQSIGELIFNLLSTTLTFIDPDPTQRNKSRWPISAFWKDFLGDTKELSLKPTTVENSLIDTQHWLIQGGCLSAIKAFEILKSHDALGELFPIEALQDKTQFSNKLTKKLEEHLYNINREDVIPEIQRYSK